MKAVSDSKGFGATLDNEGRVFGLTFTSFEP